MKTEVSLLESTLFLAGIIAIAGFLFGFGFGFGASVWL